MRSDRDAHTALLDRFRATRPPARMPRGRNKPVVGAWAKALYLGLVLLVLAVSVGGVLVLWIGGRK